MRRATATSPGAPISPLRGPGQRQHGVGPGVRQRQLRRRRSPGSRPGRCSPGCGTGAPRPSGRRGPGTGPGPGAPGLRAMYSTVGAYTKLPALSVRAKANRRGPGREGAGGGAELRPRRGPASPRCSQALARWAAGNCACRRSLGRGQLATRAPGWRLGRGRGGGGARGRGCGGGRSVGRMRTRRRSRRAPCRHQHRAPHATARGRRPRARTRTPLDDANARPRAYSRRAGAEPGRRTTAVCT